MSSQLIKAPVIGNYVLDSKNSELHPETECLSQVNDAGWYKRIGLYFFTLYWRHSTWAYSTYVNHSVAQPLPVSSLSQV